jgi:hypothetical protein
MRRVNVLTGALTTLAGNNAAGPVGDGGVATATAFSSALGFACASAAGPAGNLAITDGWTVRLAAARTGTFYRRAMTAGHLYIVAGGGTRILGDGGPATRATSAPVNVAVSATGSLLVTDDADNRVRAIAP